MNKLVSVVVITYNSSKYITETLNSIYSQTYDAIELIVSDDCSTDDTVEICRSWIDENKDRFVRTELITVEKNTGVSPNIKRGFEASKGFYLKSIAGDDCLEMTAIQEYVSFLKKNNSEVCVCELNYINSESKKISFKAPIYDTYIADLKKGYDFQRQRILTGLFIPGPPVFLTMNLYQTIKEKAFNYPFADEWPLFYNIIYAGYQIYPLGKKLILYRVHESLCRGNSNGLINKRVFLDSKRFFKEVISKELQRNKMYLSLWDLNIKYIINEKKYSNKNTSYILLNLINPIWYKRKFFTIKIRNK